MPTFLDIENAAQRLRRQLRYAARPDLRILCTLKFFQLFDLGIAATGQADPLRILFETYAREFIPPLAIQAVKCSPHELLPADADQLATLIASIEAMTPGAVDPADLERLRELHRRVGEPRLETGELADHAIHLTGLFVEDNPDLGLESRGRLLSLTISASRLASELKDDDVVIRNPTAEPDDQFRTQAHDAVRAARSYLSRRYGLNAKKHYRFDVEVACDGARLTGPSLGLALAVGTVAALARLEVLRDRLAIAPAVALSGSLSADGKLLPVDAKGLRLKVERAFHSRLDYLVVPRENLIPALQHLSELQRAHPSRTLELCGADTLESVIRDPRLIVTRRSSAPVHVARKAWKAKRSAWVEVPVLGTLALLLFCLVAPKPWMPWFDRNPAIAHFNLTANSLDVFNRDSVLVWADTLPCKLLDDAPCYRQVVDLDGDGKNEVLFVVPTVSDCAERAWLFRYSWDNKEVFRRCLVLLGKYPGDTAGVLYGPGHLNVVKVAGKSVIITEEGQSNPGRGHIRLWSANGDSLGWYVNAGGSGFQLAKDLGGDGREELLFNNYNNRMECSALLVIRADSVHGCSPPYEDSSLDLSWVEPGNQLAYVLFPVSDLGEVDLVNRYNDPEEIREYQERMIDVYISESTHSLQSNIVYRFDSRLRIVEVIFTDQYKKRWSQLLPPVDWGEYAIRVRDSVRYWTDSGWVTESQRRHPGKP